MIARLRGAVIETGIGEVIIDVNGVGYKLHVPDSTLRSLPETGEEATLHVHTHVREDAIQLYGFANRSELRLFETVVGVSGIGPRLGLVILSHLSPDAFARAVLAGDSSVLTKIPGIGKKSAARILLELKDKLQAGWSTEAESVDQSGVSPAEDGGIYEDAVAALVTLGYGEHEARAAVRDASEQEAEDQTVETIIRRSLRRLDRAV